MMLHIWPLLLSLLELHISRTNTLEVKCYDDVITVDPTAVRPGVDPACFHVSRERVTWAQASVTCHQMGGWLANGLGCSHLPEFTKVMLQTTPVWSGYRVKERRLLADGFPTPLPTRSQELPDCDHQDQGDPFSSQWEDSSAGHGGCVKMYVSNKSCEVPSSGSARDDSPCQIAKPLYSFESCQDENRFVCLFATRYLYIEDTFNLQYTPPPQLSMITNYGPGIISKDADYDSCLFRNCKKCSDRDMSLCDTFFIKFQCNVTLSSAIQGVTFYKNGVPVKRQLLWLLSKQIGTSYLASYDEIFAPTVSDISKLLDYDIIDVAGAYKCEVNDGHDNTLVSSNEMHVKLKDYEVYSLRIALKDEIKYHMLSWEYVKHSLLGNWSGINLDDTPMHSVENILASGEQLDSAQLTRLLASSLNTLYTVIGVSNLVTNGFKLKPLSFESSELMLYYYKENEEKCRSAEFEHETKVKLQLANGTKEFKIDSFSMKSIDCCTPEVKFEFLFQRNYSLPIGQPGKNWSSREACGSRPLVEALCSGDIHAGYEWGSLRVNPQCAIPKRVDHAMSDDVITEESMSAMMDEMLLLTQSLTPDTARVKDVVLVADVLDMSLQLDHMSSSVVSKIMQVADNVNKLPGDVIGTAQETQNSANKILHTLDALGTKLKFAATDKDATAATTATSAKTTSMRLVSDSMALEVWDVKDDYDTNHVVGLTLQSDGAATQVDSNNLQSMFSEDVTWNNTEVAIILPEEFFKDTLAMSHDVRLAMHIYNDTTLYNKSSSNNDSFVINSMVVAAQIIVDGEMVTNLTGYNVTTVFHPRQTSTNGCPDDVTCVYWSFSANNNSGGWRSDGCHLESIQSERDVCVCNHLTNFAVLMNYYDQCSLDNEHNLTLSLITVFGLSLSIGGLLFSIISFLCIRNLRQSLAKKTLFHLSLALLLSWVTFLAGIHQTAYPTLCLSVAALLHYLILASFMWMLMEGILQCLLFVKGVNTNFPNYMLKTGVPAWTLPAVPVLSIYLYDVQLYHGGDHYCWMSQQVFYLGFAAPVGLIIAANCTIFVLVVASLCRRKDMSRHSSSGDNHALVNIRASFICFSVLGLSWIFGFLAIEDARVVFQYIFCFTASMQGFVMCVMMTARDVVVRQFWAAKCCRRRRREEKTSYNLSEQRTRHGSKDTLASFPSTTQIYV